MEDKNLEEPVPEGWELKDEGSKTSDFKINKLKRKRMRMRNKPSSAARGNFGGQSSRPPPLNPGKERNGLEETAEPMESNDTGEDIEVGEAGKSIEASDLEASEAMKE
ncbi:unnamed protein product [Malus baccata var. baccata]